MLLARTALKWKLNTHAGMNRGVPAHLQVFHLLLQVRQLARRPRRLRPQPRRLLNRHVQLALRGGDARGGRLRAAPA
jgi:hypothetical protein